MARISPFAAWRYSLEHVQLSEVVTQPYDKITSEMQERYYQASPYNLVRIILGKHLPGDAAQENVYTRAAASFEDWRRSGVLRRDPDLSIYCYSQAFTVPGGKAQVERRGFIGLGRLEEYSAGVVFRHEQTLAKPKADRLQLLRATRAHFGQIFMLYSGSGEVDAILRPQAAPDMEVTDEYGVLHCVWKVSDPAAIRSLQAQMQDKKLIIADGHHRYETALTYRNEQRAGSSAANDSPRDWAMMTFVDLDSPGLIILPAHRVVSGRSSFASSQFRARVSQYFQVEEVDSGIDSARAAAILHSAGKSGTALLAVTRNRAFLLHSPKSLATKLLGGLSPRQQALDVVVLHRCLLESVLNISEEAIRNQRGISYQREAADALAQVRNGDAQVAFLMNPVRIDQVRDIALGGEVLPQKSTDFYPKLLSGLTIYALD